MYNPGFHQPAPTTMATVYSRINKNELISYNQWHLSMLRRKNANQPRHTFLVAEGINADGVGVTRRYDFVCKKDPEREGEYLDGLAEVLAIRRSNIALEMMGEAVEKLTRYEGSEDALYYVGWMITRDEAQLLDQNIQQEMGIDMPYSNVGKKSLSTSNEGESCFDFSRRHANAIVGEARKVPELLTDYLVADPALYLTDEPTSGGKLRMCKNM